MFFHNKPSQRASWAFHGHEGWYIGPALDHYWNITAYFPDTQTEEGTDTVTFIPHDTPIPSITMEDYLLQAVDDILSILKTSNYDITPIMKIGDATRNALLEIAITLKSTVTPPSLPSSTSLPIFASEPELRMVVPQPQPISESRVPSTKDNT